MILWAGWAQLGILLPVSPAGLTPVAAVTGKPNQGWMITGGLVYLPG